MRDFVLRAGGSFLIAAGSFAVRLVPALAAGWSAIGLAGLAFLGVSGGSALLVLGQHVDDPVELGERWTIRRGDRTD